MHVSAGQPTRSDERLTRLCLILGVVVWFLHQNTVYALASLSCEWGWFPFTILGVSGLRLIETAITVVASLLMLLMVYLPWRSWRRFQTAKPAQNPRLMQDTENDRRPLTAFIAMALNIAFLLFVIASCVPIYTLNPCGQG